jgi:hypothetical protein
MPPKSALRILSLSVAKNSPNNNINYTGIPTPMRSLYKNYIKNLNNPKTSNSPKSVSEIKNFLMLFKRPSPHATPRTLQNVLINSILVKYPGISNKNARILASWTTSPGTFKKIFTKYNPRKKGRFVIPPKPVFKRR